MSDVEQKMEEMFNEGPTPSTSTGIQFGDPIIFAPSTNVDGQGDLAAFTEDQFNNIDYVVAAPEEDETPGFFEIQSDNKAFPFGNDKFSDIKIKYETPEGKKNVFPAHKVILMQNSGYFAVLLDEDFPFQQTVVHIVGKMIDERVFTDIMELLYTGRAKVPKAKKDEFDEIKKLFRIGETARESAVIAEPPKIANRNFSMKARTPKTPKVKPLRIKVPKESSGTPTPSKKVKVEQQDGDQPAGEPYTKEQLSEVSNYAVLLAEEGGSYCLICSSKFTQMTNAKTHFKTKHGFVGGDAESLHCHNCGITCSTLELVQHYRTSGCGSLEGEKTNKDLLAEAAQNIVKTEDRKFMCLKCDSSFTQMTNAKTHYKTKHDENATLEFCVLCGKRDKQMPQMHNHLQKEHGGLKRKDITSLIKKFVGA